MTFETCLTVGGEDMSEQLVKLLNDCYQFRLVYRCE